MNKFQFGYYYSERLKTLIIGYLKPRPYGNDLVGKVIGHSIPPPSWGHTYNYGYTYSCWIEGFVYVGRLTTYTTLEGYLDFLKESDTRQIEGYFKSKSIVLEHHYSHIVKHTNGVRYRVRYNPETLKRLGVTD